MAPLEHPFLLLAVALGVGLLVGAERGWEERGAAEGGRIAGVRTYGLLGLLGGGAALVSQHAGAVVLGLGVVAVAGVLTVAYVARLPRTSDLGITSLVAGVATFVFGALAGLGDTTTAGAAAVVMALLLRSKTLLHRWISALEPAETRAAIELLLISVVLLPILPDQGFGPWQALNPYEIWWMVVLIALISFIGYFAIKIGGPRRGGLFTALFAGLASSTALTLHFSRLARQEPPLARTLAPGILLACGVMFPRMVVVAGIVNRDLVGPLLPPAVAMGLIVYVSALGLWRSGGGSGPEAQAPLRNPLELGAVLGFGVLLAAILVASQGLQVWLGERGVLLLAAASGVADVDAITLSLARMGNRELTADVVVWGVVTAAAVNTVVKAGMAASLGGRPLALRVALPLLASAAVGPAALWWLRTGG